MRMISKLKSSAFFWVFACHNDSHTYLAQLKDCLFITSQAAVMAWNAFHWLHLLENIQKKGRKWQLFALQIQFFQHQIFHLNILHTLEACGFDNIHINDSGGFYPHKYSLCGSHKLELLFYVGLNQLSVGQWFKCLFRKCFCSGGKKKQKKQVSVKS